MKLWQDLVNSALLGTERRPWQATSGSARVEMILREIAAESPADLLLRAAAVVWVYRIAGESPARSTDPRLPACPTDSLPKSGPRTASHLVTMLKGSYQELLPTAFVAMAEARQRLPDELLPAFLELAERKQNLRALLSAVAGARGKWLADQNPAWRRLNAEDIPPAQDVQTLWETASMEQRIGLLHQLRKTAPEKAIDLIASTWDQEKADHRAQLLGALRVGLTVKDEPFLEQRLDDKSIVVRRAAADVLAGLPDSQLCLRMQARLQPMLRLESKGLLRRTEVIEVSLPAGVDAAMQRDGIRPQASGAGGGEKASLISQMLGMGPPSVWSKAFSRSPKELLAAAAAGDWKDLLWSAWMKASERHRNVEWALALAQVLPAESTPEQLLQMLPEQERDTLLCRAVEDADASVLILQISRFPGPWSLRLTGNVLKRIRNAGERERSLLCRAALTALPFLDPQATAEMSDDWPPEMSDLAAGLQFKHNLLGDIRNRC